MSLMDFRIRPLTRRRSSTMGEIVNLMSVDSQKLLEICVFLHLVWSVPLRIIAAIVFLAFELAECTLVGVFVCVCVCVCVCIAVGRGPSGPSP